MKPAPRPLPSSVELPDADATESLGERIALHLHPGDCVLLHGDLGAGKTTLVRGLARGLGCDADQVSSPTFVTMQVYEGESHSLVHIDAYRSSSGTASRGAIDLDEWLRRPEMLIVIEWPERFPGKLPSRVFHLSLEHTATGRLATVRDERQG
ncbi:MAG: tRNA (adenosine(37)-N6)-threonylcarbamoyltransferase complex ATPase subunit type 1 TsaE [Planctomycetota bacterium]|nr:tRNA (adenosine(37)-N6)-threonylcarbamoyltransferase complex ATPase subunit type 1 TsaE [Planctomycetota bacterium]MDA1105094.1 tRNA (adenosine(37)-N6)-threonylcarbamoyltransferase complex ATPase subunit type 1 TsaE [Planctomycetota bacterium]